MPNLSRKEIQKAPVLYIAPANMLISISCVYSCDPSLSNVGLFLALETGKKMGSVWIADTTNGL